MNPELIARVIGLIGKNGDRVVLADPQAGKAVVVMDLAAYEKLVAGSQPAPSKSSLNGQIIRFSEPESSPPAVKPQLFSNNLKKKAKPSDFSVIEVKPPVVAKEPAAAADLAGLTQDELLDKINRDIGAWKTAQESKRTEELQSAFNAAPIEMIQSLEEEEQFYLEPIE